jgi:hypothetical protein
MYDYYYYFFKIDMMKNYPASLLQGQGNGGRQLRRANRRESEMMVAHSSY